MLGFEFDVKRHAMHELAVCEELLLQVRAVAERNGAERVGRITVRIGPLSGVEPELLERAFGIARRGRMTVEAELVVETAPVTIRCRDCDHENRAAPNRLLCDACGSWRVDLLEGDEMLLASVELVGVDESAARRAAGDPTREANCHV